jgi:glycosyltransferase involved in cell wall biosynthesis
MVTKQAQPSASPFWSVMIPTYNPDLSYLKQAVQGVLLQQGAVGEMQIEIVDDCSPAWDAEQLWNIFRDPKVCVYRQPRRLGMTGNWNSCIDRARGSWIHILHQVDQVLPGFYRAFAILISDDYCVVVVLLGCISFDV